MIKQTIGISSNNLGVITNTDEQILGNPIVPISTIVTITNNNILVDGCNIIQLNIASNSTINALTYTSAFNSNQSKLITLINIAASTSVVLASTTTGQYNFNITSNITLSPGQSIQLCSTTSGWTPTSTSQQTTGNTPSFDIINNDGTNIINSDWNNEVEVIQCSGALANVTINLTIAQAGITPGITKTFWILNNTNNFNCTVNTNALGCSIFNSSIAITPLSSSGIQRLVVTYFGGASKLVAVSYPTELTSTEVTYITTITN